MVQYPAPLREGLRTAIRAVTASGMPVDLALIFLVSHVVPLTSERIASPCPAKDSVGGHLREFANESKILCLYWTLSPQKSSRFGALERLRSSFLVNGRHLRIFIRLDQYRSPQAALGITHTTSRNKSISDDLAGH